MSLYRRLVSPSGRARYTPVAEEVAIDALPAGYHLVHVEPGCRSVIYGVNPDHAALLAAARDAEGPALAELSRLRAETQSGAALTPTQAAAWRRLERLGVALTWSPRSAWDAAVRVLVERARGGR